MDVMTTVSELQPDLRLITRAEFTRMHEAGLFADEQVELLEGVIVTMAAEGGPHVRATMWLNNHLARTLPDEVMVGVNHPYAAGDLSLPQPDLVVVAAEDVRTIVDGVVGARLLIEVAMTSRRRDLVTKARIYAQAGIEEYWVLDLVGRAMVVHREPGPDGYASVAVVEGDGQVSACGVTVAMPDLLDFVGPTG